MKTIIFIRPLRERELMITTALKSEFQVVIIDQPNSELLGLGDVRITVSSIRDYDAVFEAAIRISQTCNVVGVYTTLDYLLPVLAKINDTLNLKGVVGDQGQILFNKKLQKQAFKENDLPSAASELVTDTNQISIKFPCIIKPTDRTGSRGVYKINNANEYSKYISLSLEESWSSEVLVEEFLEGEEFSVEGYVQSGKYHLVGVTGKHKSISNTIIEDSIIFPLDKVNHSELENLMADTHRALGLDNVVTHIEVISTKRGLFLVEVNGRIGGALIPDMVLRSSGVNLYDIQYKLFLGQDVSFTWQNGYAVQSVIKHGVGKILSFSVPKLNSSEEIFIYKSTGNILDEPAHKNDAIGYVLTWSSDMKNAIDRNSELNNGRIVNLQ